MPASVPMMNFLAGLVRQYSYMPLVEQTWSARAETSGAHSGWHMKSASGCSSFFLSTASTVIRSWVGQYPSQKMNFFSGTNLATQRPRLRSGTKISSSSLRDLTTLRALAEVQQMSEWALTSAEELT